MRNQPKHDARADDRTRADQYLGIDPSGYKRAPQATEGHEAQGEWREPTPGNYGEAGGRWHDHEAPYESARALAGDDALKREGAEEEEAPGQPEAGFLDHARGLWWGGPGGTFGYAGGGREGHAPEVAEIGGAPESKPAKARVDAKNQKTKEKSGTTAEASTPDDEATGHASAVGTSPSATPKTESRG